ncbi:MAG: hypothetical protein JSW08_02895 [archaeon]|nr:MAG: hypothetical protein JSW08_02895 [archaeon]
MPRFEDVYDIVGSRRRELNTYRPPEKEDMVFDPLTGMEVPKSYCAANARVGSELSGEEEIPEITHEMGSAPEKRVKSTEELAARVRAKVNVRKLSKALAEKRVSSGRPEERSLENALRVQEALKKAGL